MSKERAWAIASIEKLGRAWAIALVEKLGRVLAIVSAGEHY